MTCVMCGIKPKYKKQSYCYDCCKKKSKLHYDNKKEIFQKNRKHFIEWYNKTTPVDTRRDNILTRVNK